MVWMGRLRSRNVLGCPRLRLGVFVRRLVRRVSRGRVGLLGPLASSTPSSTSSILIAISVALVPVVSGSFLLPGIASSARAASGGVVSAIVLVRLPVLWREPLEFLGGLGFW